MVEGHVSGKHTAGDTTDPATSIRTPESRRNALLKACRMAPAGPRIPAKTFLSGEDAKTLMTETAETLVPRLPERPTTAPRLPCRPSSQRPPVVHNTAHPREDQIYTHMQPLPRGRRFFPASALGDTLVNAASAPSTLPGDFQERIVCGSRIVGLQQGRVMCYDVDAMGGVAGEAIDRSGVGDRGSPGQIHALVGVPYCASPNAVSNPRERQGIALLALHDSGQLLRVALPEGSQPGRLSPAHRGPLPRCAQLLMRPGSSEVWAIGGRETAILLVNGEGEVALVRTIPSHFPGAAVSFLGADELAVVSGVGRDIDIYSLHPQGHHPALVASLPLPLDFSPVVRVCRLSSRRCVSFHVDGKLVYWDFAPNDKADMDDVDDVDDVEKDGGKGRDIDGEDGLVLAARTVVPLTLYRIQCVHGPTEDGFFWLGLHTGKMMVIDPRGEAVRIVAEMRLHGAAIRRLLPDDTGRVLHAIDANGAVSVWDAHLTLWRLNQELWRREHDYCDELLVRLRICSWNVAGLAPHGETSTAVWQQWLLGTGDGGGSVACDLLVVGLQEIVALEARKALLGAPGASSAALDEWIRVISRHLPPTFQLLHSASMVGLGLLVFCQGSHLRVVRGSNGDAVKTGLGGLHGNKGALCWRAFVHDTPVAFVVGHFAAGQSAVAERNADVATILRSAAFPTVVGGDPFVFPTGNRGNRILDHAATFLFGDLNYRIDLERERCEQLALAGAWGDLQAVDQLTVQLTRRDLLLGAFREATSSLLHPPTYKYVPGSRNDYDTSDKRRIPAWCDRILYHECDRGAGAKSLVATQQYGSVHDAVLSDHKPIYGQFVVQCRRVDRRARGDLLAALIGPADELFHLLHL